MERRALKTQEPKQPEHYAACHVEPIQVIASMGDAAAFYRGNIIKYLMRYQHSDEPMDDLHKLIDYATRLYEHEGAIRSNS